MCPAVLHLLPSSARYWSKLDSDCYGTDELSCSVKLVPARTSTYCRLQEVLVRADLPGAANGCPCPHAPSPASSARYYGGGGGGELTCSVAQSLPTVRAGRPVLAVARDTCKPLT